MYCKVKVVSFSLKGGSAPGTKSKKLKESNKNFNSNKNKLGGMNDKRSFLNNKNMSEEKKSNLRMQLQNNKSKINSFSKDDNLFTPKDWSNDPMMKSVKQLGQFDEGLDESSDDYDNEEDGKRLESSSKYFSDGHTIIKKKKMTLKDTIHESKIRKADKQLENEKNINTLRHTNEVFRDKIRQYQSKIGESIKTKIAKEGSEKKTNEKVSNIFGELSFMIETSAKPVKKEDNKSIITISDKKLSDKKVDKLHEKLKNAGIISEGDREVNESDVESEEESENNEDGDSEDNNDEDNEVDNSVESCDEVDNSEESGDEVDNSEESGNEDDVSEEETAVVVDEESDEGNTERTASKKSESTSLKRSIQHIGGDAIDMLRSLVSETKTKKRRLGPEEEIVNEKVKIESNKSELDCLRLLIEMDDVKRDVMMMMSSKVDSSGMTVDEVVKKVVVATLFQEMLKNNHPYSFSPELLRFIRTVFNKAVKDSDHWLSVKEDVSNLIKSQILNICNKEREDTARLAVSTIFHLIKILESVIISNKKLPYKSSVFYPLKNVIECFPLTLYPQWLREEINVLHALLDNLNGDSEILKGMKKKFKIVELLEPDIHDKFASRKDVTKTLKKKVKNERKALKKDIKFETKSKIMKEIDESRKNSDIRNRKTMAILNNLHQI